jgi:hypothetical protein
MNTVAMQKTFISGKALRRKLLQSGSSLTELPGKHTSSLRSSLDEGTFHNLLHKKQENLKYKTMVKR